MLFFKLIFKEIYHFFKNKNGREFLKLAFWYGKKPRYKIHKIRTLGYKLEIPDVLSWLWQFEEIFFQEFYLFSSQKDDKNIKILDCGANVGMSCLYFKSKFPNAKIIAFEPDTKIASFLEKNLKNNLPKTQFEQIEIHQKAVWVHNEGVDFESDGADGGMITNEEKIFVQNDKKIPSISLKEVLLAGNTEIDMLKIDIEGAETQVLKDCENALGNVKNIFIEYHAYINQPQTLHIILEILTKNNFRYFIKNSLDRKSPFVNQKPKNNSQMDMQLNIFAYKN